jgi:hypothetical protein
MGTPLFRMPIALVRGVVAVEVDSLDGGRRTLDVGGAVEDVDLPADDRDRGRVVRRAQRDVEHAVGQLRRHRQERTVLERIEVPAKRRAARAITVPPAHRRAILAVTLGKISRAKTRSDDVARSPSPWCRHDVAPSDLAGRPRSEREVRRPTYGTWRGCGTDTDRGEASSNALVRSIRKASRPWLCDER